MDPLQWMGAVRMRVQTADKNITIIPNMTPVHQFIYCQGKSCMYVINKSVKMLIPWKKTSLVVFSHPNPPTYLFRAVLDCFIQYRKCLWLHFYLYPSVLHGFISYKHARWPWWTGLVLWITEMFLSAWIVILTAPIQSRVFTPEQVM